MIGIIDKTILVLIIEVSFTHLDDLLWSLVVFSTVNNDSFEHGTHEFCIPLFKIDLPVGVAEDLLRGFRKRPEVLYVR